MKNINTYDERIERKMIRLEKWMGHLQNRMTVLQEEMWLLKEVYNKNSPKDKSSKKVKLEQLTFFGT